jgi:hypothetical protein
MNILQEVSRLVDHDYVYVIYSFVWITAFFFFSSYAKQ